MRRAQVDFGASQLAVLRDGTSRVLIPDVDYQASADFLREKVTTEAALVYAGYGVSAPELGYDDFAGVDVQGKVLVTFRGAPPRFDHNLRAYYSSPLEKERMAAAHGAIGILEVRKPVEEHRAPWEKTARQGHLPAMRWVDEAGAPSNVQALLQVGARLSRSGVDALLEGAPRTFEQLLAAADSSQPASFELPARIKSIRVTRHSPASSPNVVGLLRGSDPKLANECIVVSAHLDHLGIGVPVDGDSVYNGAYDNATGIAMMLELARTLKSLPRAPGRSVLFLAVCGEEKGMQGSDYFARHEPPAGLTVVGNVNLDMVMLLRPMRAVIGFGAEHSTLGGALEWAARQSGLAVVPDPVPQEVIFVRSDQISFVRQGIPAIYPVSAGDGTPAHAGEMEAWSAAHYHAPSDDMAGPFDWDSGARFARMALLTVWKAANDPAAPRWNEGDFFGTRFGPRK